MRKSYKWQPPSPEISGMKAVVLHGAQWRHLHLQGQLGKAIISLYFLNAHQVPHARTSLASSYLILTTIGQSRS